MRKHASCIPIVTPRTAKICQGHIGAGSGMGSAPALTEVISEMNAWDMDGEDFWRGQTEVQDA